MSPLLAQRYFCSNTSIDGKLVPDFVLPGNFLKKQRICAQVARRDNLANASEASELAFLNF
jgi:hypothetical protein